MAGSHCLSWRLRSRAGESSTGLQLSSWPLRQVITVFISTSRRPWRWPLHITYGPVCFIMILHVLPHGSAFFRIPATIPIRILLSLSISHFPSSIWLCFLFLFRFVFPQVVHSESEKGKAAPPHVRGQNLVHRNLKIVVSHWFYKGLRC